MVTPDVLIPRPETEDIVTIAKQLKPKSILDIGTGSGCIAITLALELTQSEITATDISRSSLEIARKNWQQLAKNHKIKFQKSDLFQNLPNQKFDLITANLPYVDEAWPWLDQQALAHEPSQALYAKDHGLAVIKKFLTTVSSHLTSSAHVLLEADPAQHQEIITYAQKHKLIHTQTANYIIHLTYSGTLPK